MTKKEKVEALETAISVVDLGSDGSPEMVAVLHCAKRVVNFEKFDAAKIFISVFHNGLAKNPWLFEIRRNGMLRGMFEGVPTHFATRLEAEIMAFEVAESMLDGTFEIRFTA